MRKFPPLVPHVLQLVDVGHRPPASLGCFLGYGRESWSLQRDIQDAFVFPSEALARRTAIWMLTMRGESWLPLPAEGRVSPVSGPDANGPHRCRGCGCTDLFACPGGCDWVEPDLCSACHRAPPIESWAVFQHPVDFPDRCVARRLVGGTPTQDLLEHETLEGLRALLPAGLVPVPRDPRDVAALVETWL